MTKTREYGSLGIRRLILATMSRLGQRYVPFFNRKRPNTDPLKQDGSDRAWLNRNATCLPCATTHFLKTDAACDQVPRRGHSLCTHPAFQTPHSRPQIT